MNAKFPCTRKCLYKKVASTWFLELLLCLLRLKNHQPTINPDAKEAYFGVAVSAPPEGQL